MHSVEAVECSVDHTQVAADARLPKAPRVLDVLVVEEIERADANPCIGQSCEVGFASGSREGADVIATGRCCEVLAADWGWWRTCTGNLEKLPTLLAESPGLAPPLPRFDPLAQAALLLEVAMSVPKTMKWRLRANVGDRMRWYELPEEVAH